VDSWRNKVAKNLSLKDKLEKLSSKKVGADKSTPILKAKKAADAGRSKIDDKLSTLNTEKKAPGIPIPPVLQKEDEKKPSPQEAKKVATPEEIDSLISKSEIDKMVSKIERELDLKLPRAEKAEQKTIKNFEIPTTEEIKDIIGLAAVMDETGEKRLNQLLYLKDEPEAEPQWTVMRDQSAEEFAMIVKEGLRQFKTRPLVYGMEFEKGVILVSHREGFTITLACYELEIAKMLQIFISLMEYIEKQM
jgi:hypothetical protein